MTYCPKQRRRLWNADLSQRTTKAEGMLRKLTSAFTAKLKPKRVLTRIELRRKHA